MPVLTTDQRSKFEALIANLIDDWKKLKAALKAGDTAAPTGFFSSIGAGLASAWNTLKTTAEGLVLPSGNQATAWQYVTAGLEQLVKLADSFNIAGVDKKSLVLQYGEELFNAVVVAEFPGISASAMSMGESVFVSALSGIVEYIVANLHSAPSATTTSSTSTAPPAKQA